MAAPQTVQVEVIDDCGNPVTAKAGGLVQVMFSGAPATTTLGSICHDVGSGIWEATWTPVNAAKQIVLQVEASEAGFHAESFAEPRNQRDGNGAGCDREFGAASDRSSQRGERGASHGGGGCARELCGDIRNGTGRKQRKSVRDVFAAAATLNGTQLLLGGIAMPLIYAGAIR